MIQFLHIENFQSHKETDLIFHPGVNVIVGTSDSGKSAILRALRLVAWNRPSGDSVRSWWGGKTEIQVGIEDEKILVRRKDKAEEYIFAKSGKKDISFKAFGTEVPKEITEQLNLTDINLQRQMDKPFLLSSTAGEVAAYFNKIAKLDKINTATANVNKWVRELETDIKYKEADIKRDTIQLSTFDYLDKMEMEIEVLEEMSNRLTAKNNKSKQLTVLINNIELIEWDLSNTKPILDLEDSVNSVLELIEKKKQKVKEHDSLIDMLTSINETSAAIDYHTFSLSLETQVNKIYELKGKKESKATAITSLSEIINDINDINDNLNIKIEYLAGKEETFKNEFPETCPLCGTIIKK